MDKFRRHFNETKLKQGTFRKQRTPLRLFILICTPVRSSEEGKEGDNEGGDTSAPEDKSEDNDESNGDDSDSKSSRKRYKLALPSESETRTAVDIDNPPVFAAVYRDAATKTDRVVICAGMFGIPDAKDVHVDLDEDDAQTAIISYGWPAALFSPQVMCATWASTDEPQTYYGRLNALDEELAHHRPSYSQAPRTTFRIRLPIPVNPDTSTWKKVGVNSATSGRFVLWELAANKPPYAVPLADKIVSEFVEHEPAETMQ